MELRFGGPKAKPRCHVPAPPCEAHFARSGNERLQNGGILERDGAVGECGRENSPQKEVATKPGAGTRQDDYSTFSFPAQQWSADTYLNRQKQKMTCYVSCTVAMAQCPAERGKKKNQKPEALSGRIVCMSV